MSVPERMGDIPLVVVLAEPDFELGFGEKRRRRWRVWTIVIVMRTGGGWR